MRLQLIIAEWLTIKRTCFPKHTDFNKHMLIVNCLQLEEESLTFQASGNRTPSLSC